MAFKIEELDTDAYNPYEVIDGDWVSITKDGDKPGLWGCCDCGLMHRVEFMVEDGIVFMRVHRDQEATRIRRDAMYEKEK